jgi:hypothetical protein
VSPTRSRAMSRHRADRAEPAVHQEQGGGDHESVDGRSESPAGPTGEKQADVAWAVSTLSG